MADRFLVEQRGQPKRPATHVIVIGVGHYPHLPGGGSPVQIENSEGLKQLTSPPISAREVAAWFIQHYNNPSRPLATVALLLSEREPTPFRNPRTGEDHQVEVATIENIEEALNQWRKRGEGRRRRSAPIRTDQRLIFYFCGHGIARGTSATLLASNYGEKEYRPLAGAIDLPAMRAAMAVSGIPEQLYIVDACRVASTSLMGSQSFAGNTIFQDNVLLPRTPGLRAPTFYATLPGDTAYGLIGESSFYTRALTFSLNGAGAVKTGPAGWRVTTLRLQEALDFYIERALKVVGRTGTPPTDDQVPMDLHFPTNEPLGTAVVTTDPTAAVELATLTFQGKAGKERRGKADRGEWIVELPTGNYVFQAEFAGGQWRSEAAEAYIQPVFYDVPIKVTR